ncbi:PR-1-like protein [Mycena rebaudengoi]|nr:PR-1-like protein [Mycena rebaudengoi]
MQMFALVLLTLTSITLALATPNTRQSSSLHAERALSVSSINAFLSAHNTERAEHGAPNLVWNSTLAQAAKTWARSCQLKHSDGSLLDRPYGENLVAATGDFSIEEAVAQFTSDKSQYHPSNPTYNHWTQVVWKATTQLGCAVARCSDVMNAGAGKAASYYVCLYDPPGNVVGTAPANVQV